jgi:hypothetical protein
MLHVRVLLNESLAQNARSQAGRSGFCRSEAECRNRTERHLFCTEQDVMEDVFAQRPELFEEFTTTDFGGWGWAGAEPVTRRCERGWTNIGNKCTRDSSEGQAPSWR